MAQKLIAYAALGAAIACLIAMSMAMFSPNPKANFAMWFQPTLLALPALLGAIGGAAMGFIRRG